MSAIVPNPDAIEALLKNPDQGPIVMLNLLKFKPRADGAKGSGEDAYNRYGAVAIKMVEAAGGRLLWSGRPTQVMIGGDADKWDAIALVQYPSARAFFEMVSNADYQQAHAHREAGLERTVLIACLSVDYRAAGKL
jgi:uncharacterized protein (DUF1330 family)